MITFKGIGISVNPPMKDWDNSSKFDQSIILYSVRYGKVFGGSDPGRKVKEVESDSDGYWPGGDFTFELDLSNRSLIMEIEDERIILDANLGDFEYSPFVKLSPYFTQEITLL